MDNPAPCDEKLHLRQAGICCGVVTIENGKRKVAVGSSRALWDPALCSHLKVEYCALFWSPPITRDIVNSHKLQSKSIQIIKELDSMPMAKGKGAGTALFS